MMFCDLSNIVANALAACRPLCALDRQLTGVWLSQAIFTKVIEGTVGHDTGRDLITRPLVNLKYMFIHA